MLTRVAAPAVPACCFRGVYITTNPKPKLETPACCFSVCIQDPNALKLTLPEGIVITSRVLRRSEEQVSDDRFETSEFLQQVFDDGSIGASWTACRAWWLSSTQHHSGCLDASWRRQRCEWRGLCPRSYMRLFTMATHRHAHQHAHRPAAATRDASLLLATARRCHRCQWQQYVHPMCLLTCSLACCVPAFASQAANRGSRRHSVTPSSSFEMKRPPPQQAALRSSRRRL